HSVRLGWRMNGQAKPAEHVGRFQQRAYQHDGDPNVEIADSQGHDELPFRPESREWRQSRYRDDQYAERQDRSWSSGEDRPILKAFLADVTGQPEKPDFGEQVIDEQPTDHQEHRVFGVESVEQGRGDRQQAHLADRRIAEKTLRVRLLEAD